MGVTPLSENRINCTRPVYTSPLYICRKGGSSEVDKTLRPYNTLSIIEPKMLHNVIVFLTNRYLDDHHASLAFTERLIQKFYTAPF